MPLVPTICEADVGVGAPTWGSAAVQSEAVIMSDQHTRGKRHRQRSHTLTSSSNIEPLHPRRYRQKLTGQCPLCRVEVRVRDRP